MTMCLGALLAGCAGAPADGPSSYDSTAASASADSGPLLGDMGAPRDRARAHTELAAAYYERGNMAVALEEVRLALSSDSNYAPAHNILGLVHMDLRENPQAQRAFEQALRLSPNDADINHNYAWFLCQTQREELAIRHFLAAVKNPLYATPQKSYALAAICALRKNNERDALEFFDRSVRLDPTYLPALLGLAQLRYRRGELEDARQLIGRFNRIAEPTAESLWLALRIERKLGDRGAENTYAIELRRRFAGSSEHQSMEKGRFE